MFTDDERKSRKLESRRRYNNGIAGRLQTARVSQRRRNGLGYLTEFDDLTVENIYQILENQNYCCAASGEPLEGTNWELSHIVSVKNGGNLTYQNIEIVKKGENIPGAGVGAQNRMHIQAPGIADFLGKWFRGEL